MRRRLLVFLFAAMALCAAASAQTSLTNESVIKMVKAGLGADIIVSMVQTQPGNYTLTPDSLVALKTGGVPDKVIAAMVAKGSAPSVPTPANAVSVVTTDATPAITEIGVYYKKAGEWKELLPEVVNWKTGGALKSIASVGIVKGDVNGRLQGLSSRNHLSSPIEILIYAPEGVAVTEYQLLRLRINKEAREFRTVTGGVMHSSGGATRDLIPFEGKKIASRTFSIVLTNLQPGEYGILPPNSTSASSASAQLGKLYSFRVVE